MGQLCVVFTYNMNPFLILFRTLQQNYYKDYTLSFQTHKGWAALRLRYFFFFCIFYNLTDLCNLYNSSRMCAGTHLRLLGGIFEGQEAILRLHEIHSAGCFNELLGHKNVYINEPERTQPFQKRCL
uniref:Uncharacterized protein n=1 Tax=Ixodes ricinus TaxID=34613 RepID=A0A6B0UQ27_IXORI